MKKNYLLTLLYFIGSLAAAQPSVDNKEYQSAEALFESGEYVLALAKYESALLSLTATEATLCQLRIAETNTRLGNAQAGLEQCQQLDANLQNEPLLLAESHSIKGDAYLHLGQNEEAIESLLAGLALFEQGKATDSKEQASCYNDLGIAYWNNGNTDLSLQYLQNALNLREQLHGQNHPSVADTYNNIGLVNADINTFASVIYFKNALTIYRSIYEPNHPKIALVLNNLALQYDEQEEYAKALEYLQQVSAIWDQLYTGDHPSKAFTAFSIGNLYYHQQAYDEAQVHLDQALIMYSRLYGNKHPEIANIYNLKGDIYQKQGEYKMAVEILQMAIYANLAGQELTDIYQNPKLENYYNADILLSSLQQKSDAFETYHYNKTLKFRDLKAALETLEKADELVSHIRQIRLSEKDKISLSAKASEIYEAGVSLSYQMSQVVFSPRLYLEKTFYFAEKSKSAVLLSAIQDTNAKEFSGIPSELIATESQIKSDIVRQEQLLATNQAPEKEAELKQKLLSLNNHYNDFVRKLETDYPNYYNLKFNVKHVELPALQSALPPKTALITHFTTENRIYTFCVTADSYEVYNRPKAEDFDKQIMGLRNAMKYDVKKSFLTTAQRLYSELFPMKLKSTIDQLIIIPEGSLSTIPFETLVTDSKLTDEIGYSQMPYLIKKYNISYDNSATLFVQRKKEIEEYKGATEDILLIAPIHFSQHAYQGLTSRLNDLPGSEAEINEIKYLFKAKSRVADLLTETNASKPNVTDPSIKKYKYIHFATHGMVNESEPNLSRIFLQDGSLYSGDIYNIDIDADLVCLSACETGLGKISKGEGIIGLSRALLYAGAKNLVVSLWTVADESTSKLMIDFYNNHLYSSTYNTFSGALRKAKLSLINGEQYNRPYYWAPFVLIGE
ncbi:CHAT domain-containing protein [Reichenbachiella carrageenanivorans]|uniref:CHAT domain-containing protein n=1 Tax=Reichenbachiella carrageenanivorans TaxID=2979869 RepID=A0ABY6DB50_9BACT|nr:CHAT domain-containing protein [Reichenbachiella carrageenanivorans]UXX81065.1 CHAT domain-containing protein [Reichenbachiella carrageenanivorans]